MLVSTGAKQVNASISGIKCSAVDRISLFVQRRWLVTRTILGLGASLNGQ